MNDRLTMKRGKCDRSNPRQVNTPFMAAHTQTVPAGLVWVVEWVRLAETRIDNAKHYYIDWFYSKRLDRTTS